MDTHAETEVPPSGRTPREDGNSAVLGASAGSFAHGSVRQAELHAAVTDAARPGRLYAIPRADPDVGALNEDDAEEDSDSSEIGFNQDGLTTFLGQAGRHRALTLAQEQRLAAVISEGVLARQWLETGGEPADMEGDLARKVRAGEQAKDEFVRCNVRFVVSTARRFQGRGLELDDLIQEGCIGLNSAVAKFDVTRGYRFSLYAWWWIRQAMERAIANSGATIRLPVTTHYRVARYGRLRRRLSQELGRRPTDEELCERLEVSAIELREIRRARQMRAVSLDRPLSDALALRDLVVDVRPRPEEVVEAADLSQRVVALVDRLPEREREVVLLRFGLDDGQVRTLEELGQRFNVSRERIRQVEANALTKLRRRAKPELRAFIDCWPAPPEEEPSEGDVDAADGVDTE